jgi:hypothetical protein
MGTGEGAQAYGHGIYSAEEIDVAKNYAPRDYDYEDALSKAYNRASNSGDYEAMEVYERAMMHDTPTEIRADALDPESMIYGMQDTALRIADEISEMPINSYLYKMNIPDETIGKMLDWDAPMSGQSDYVRGLLDVKADTGKTDLIERYVKGSVKAGGDEKSVRKAVEEIMYGDEMNSYAWNVIERNPEPFDPNAFHDLLADRSRSGVKRGMDLYSDLAGKGIDPKKTSKTFGYADRLEGAKYLKEAQQRFKDAPMSSGKGAYFPKVSIDGDNFVVDTYDQFGKTHGQQAASEYLNSLGIPGIKYLDGNSRAVGQGSRNFVSFTPDHIEMLERNGVPIKGLLD